MSIISVDQIGARVSGAAVTVSGGRFDVGSNVQLDGGTGVVTATSYKGDGSALTGVAATDYIVSNSLKVIGVSTFQDTVSLPDNKSITLGNDDDLEIHHAAGANSYIKNNTLQLDLRSDTTNLNSKNNSVTFLKANASGLMATTGILTATSFEGDGSSLTGIAATDNINTNNIQVSGITTFQSLQEPFDFWMFSG